MIILSVVAIFASFVDSHVPKSTKKSCDLKKCHSRGMRSREFNGMYSRESSQQIQATAMSEFQLTTVHQSAVTFRHVYLQNTDCFRGIDATVILSNPD